MKNGWRGVAWLDEIFGMNKRMGGKGSWARGVDRGI
jgi:hypothetical protein